MSCVSASRCTSFRLYFYDALQVDFEGLFCGSANTVGVCVCVIYSRALSSSYEQHKHMGDDQLVPLFRSSKSCPYDSAPVHGQLEFDTFTSVLLYALWTPSRNAVDAITESTTRTNLDLLDKNSFYLHSLMSTYMFLYIYICNAACIRYVHVQLDKTVLVHKCARATTASRVYTFNLVL